MTNQVNQDERNIAMQEAYQIHDSDEYFKARPQLECDDRRKVFYAGHIRGYRAATQASEREINSLKQQVEELESKLEAMTDSNNLNHRLASKWADESTELTASNNQLREALETARDYQFDAVNQFHSDFAGYKEDKHKQYDEDLAKTDNALSSTPAKSL